MVFLVLLVIPLLIAVGGFLFSKGLVTRKELGLQVGVQVVVAAVSAVIVHYSNVHDTEVWNGYVASKSREQVSCEHSYDCNCHSCRCDKKGNCDRCCDTCYEHLHDYDWDVYSSNAETISINRVDRQGVDEPPRFTRVAIGEPTTVEHGYTNYIKAAPGTLFRHQGLVEKFKNSIPTYPEVFDYYRLNRLILVGGVQVADSGAWNDGLAKLNAEVGRPKQANVLVVLARNQPQEYFYALEEAWIGAKKNDIVLVIGVDDSLAPQWATVMCWTTQEIFKVKLRDDVMSLPTLNADNVVAALKKDVVESYVRKPMADFQYLEASITPTPLQWSLSLIIGLVISVILTIVSIRVDIFGDERRARFADRNDSLFGKLGMDSTFARNTRRKW
jgi:hypothetical protein